jgi:hypothetical protein
MRPHPQRLAAALVATLGWAAALPSAALPIDTGNPDLTLRFDNEVRYNAGWRMQGIDPRMSFSNPGVPVFSAVGDNQFDKGDMILNRFDLLSELDLVYKERSGLRVSAAAWGDSTYHRHIKAPDAFEPVVAAFYQNGDYANYTYRYIHGPSGEILDAFAFTSFDVGGTTTSLKLGRHNVYWGNSLFPQSAQSSIAFSQGALDNQKAAVSPGVETKELFLPQNQLTGTLTLNPEWTVYGQYSFEWRPTRFPEGATYYEYFLGAFFGPNGPAVAPTIHRPKDSGGDLGLMVKYNPASWGGANIGLAYREFYEKIAGAFYSPDFGQTLGQSYNDQKTKLIGLSAERNFGNINVGAELTYRMNTTLKTASGVQALLDSDRPARGDAIGFLVNAITLLPRTALWEGGELAAELAYNKIQRVSFNPGLNAVGAGATGNSVGTPGGYQVVGSPFCTNAAGAFGQGGAREGCITKKGAWIISANFQPRWPQALAGVDLSAPIFVSYGISGNANSATMSAGQVVYQIGLQADVYQKYVVKLAYTGGHSRSETTPSGGLTGSGTWWQNDRGWLGLSLRTSF